MKTNRIADFGLDAEYEELFSYRAEGCQQVTFAIKCYNQREYVAEAIAAAYRQTADNFEILIWDDGSADGSDRVIVDEVKRWIGQRKLSVRFCRARNNLGNLGSWLALLALAGTDFVIKADGDDISFPDRVEKCYRAWMDSGKCASVVASYVVRFVAPNRIVGLFAPVGAALALRRSAVLGYPNVIPEALASAWDDLFTIQRAMRFGHEVILKEPLVLYRLGSGVTYDCLWRHRILRSVRNERSCALQWKLDIAACAKDEDDLKHELTMCDFHVRHADLWLRVLDSAMLKDRLLAAVGVWRDHRYSLRQGCVLALSIIKADWILNCGMAVSLWFQQIRNRYTSFGPFCDAFVAMHKE